MSSGKRGSWGKNKKAIASWKDGLGLKTDEELGEILKRVDSSEDSYFDRLEQAKFVKAELSKREERRLAREDREEEREVNREARKELGLKGENFGEQGRFGDTKRNLEDSLKDSTASFKRQLGLLGERIKERAEVLPVILDVVKLRDRLKNDYSAFISLFLWEQEGIEEGIPAFHIFGFREMVKDHHQPLCIAWPRDHAKTTLAKISAVYHFLFKKHRFLAYVSNTNPIASNATRDIADMVRTPLFKQIFGDVVFDEEQESKGNYTFTISRVKEGFRKKCIIRSLGAGQQVRGLNINNQRPDYAIVDDLESAEEGEENKLGFAGLKKWFYGTFRKALDSRGYKLLQIGNYVAEKTLLGEHIKSIYWRSIKLSAITSNGKALWPARWSLSALKLDLLEYIDIGELNNWLCEMMNMPLSAISEVLKQDKIKFCEELDPSDEGIRLRCITVDPAITANMRYADNVAIIVHAYHDGVWKCAEIFTQKGLSPYDTYAEIIRLCLKWRVSVVGIETEAFQEALRSICEHEAARAGLGNTIKFVGVTTRKKSKSSRIVAFAGMINKGLYEVPLSCMSLIRSLSSYDINSKSNQDDDVPDCAAYILQMLDNFVHLMLGMDMEKPDMVISEHKGW